MNLTRRFIDHVKQQQLFSAHDNLLVAVSGGVDSVVLCELCHQAGYSFTIAHANFQLRGQASDDDEQFVRALADKYGVAIHVRLFETARYAEVNKTSIQVAARELRYNWFKELLVAGHQWLLTAHHSDDNVETMLMNFFRGTGISGLRGILPKKEHIIRPLLPFAKQDLLDFAATNNLGWREDSSNASDKYSRNYFRNTIIPLVHQVYPEAEHNLTGNGIRFREIEELYDQSVRLHKKKLLEYKGSEVHIPVLKLKKTQPLSTIMYEILKQYNFTSAQVPDAIRLLDGEHGKFMRSTTHRILKNRNWLIIADNEQTDSAFYIIERGQPEAANGLLTLETTEDLRFSADPLIAYMDGRHIVYPLILRKWKHGDYFYPLGMRKKKKVSRFLIDQKLSATQKDKVWVLETNKKICWVAGMRIDDRFKVSAKTSLVVKCRFSPQLLK